MPTSNEKSECSNLPVVYPWYEPHSSEEFSPPGEENIARSYLRQWYRLQVGDRHVALRPVHAEHNDLWPGAVESPEEMVALAGRYVLTWWNILGQHCIQWQRDEQRKTVRQIVSELGGDGPVTAVFGGEVPVGGARGCG